MEHILYKADTVWVGAAKAPNNTKVYKNKAETKKVTRLCVKVFLKGVVVGFVGGRRGGNGLGFH